MKKLICFFLVASFLYANEIDTLKNKTKKIEKEIKQKNKRINSIDKEKINIEKEIKQIEEDIAKVKNESAEILEEIKVVNKSIDYGQLNLEVSTKETLRRKDEFNAKILAVNKKKYTSNNRVEMSIAKKNFTKLLQHDLESMDHIKEIHSSIESEKKKIEDSKLKLTQLKSKLDKNKKTIENKKEKQNKLIVKLNKEKKVHQRSLTKLERQKKNIEKEIERIIKNIGVIRETIDIDVDTAIKKLGPFSRPIPGRTVTFFKEKNNAAVSNGIEISGKMGEIVKASAAGEIIYADKFQGLNHVVMIDYGNNVIGVYGNLISINTSLNQKVKKNQNIGILGLNIEENAYLYYEVRFNLKPINPEKLF